MLNLNKQHENVMYQQIHASIYRIAGKFGELTLFDPLAKKSLAN